MVSRILSSVAAVLAVAQAASAACTNPTQRKAWTTLTDAEKADYLQAEVCLMETPSKTGYAGSRTRWDELQAMHVAQVQFIHAVGSFLPWHRYFMSVHERLLRDECGYKGVLPYWDQQADLAAAPLNASSIFDAETGFGSIGMDGNDCVVDGPFANATNNLRVDLSRTDEARCLTRRLSQTQFNMVSQAQVDLCSAHTTYDDFNNCIGGAVHVSGHFAVGGIMDDVSLSPADPLFFMHHTNLDRIFWEWQSRDLANRLTDIGGPNVATPSVLIDAQPPSLPVAAFLPYFGDDGGNVTTLNHSLWSAGTMPNVTIAEVMDIRGDFVCAEYIH
ncbi:hypothetical protein MCOR07_010646 [Pyricularia oryzae]|uniref:Tyrosinase copper-binding domain-containing protein n=1 Tax=Pyricularia oryzae TaxID=318829 RepID=A0A4P7NML3_PYROR|nr:hypothetical protein MCOR19_000153 [Pyricularia oryzae]KAI6374351.1 hypothetical protein MCOR31_002838 [Pyricularia oryzae]KAI6397221.1 hypothetical protein MCOR23_006244 [Pyricularia oryzae]KAI6421485.1 hypothetical protein MCOR24_004296 [Pyricularia oryzae]KAI6453683.1 hypothetical protein MCOR22_000302 [Pyricularia oryzae]